MRNKPLKGLMKKSGALKKYDFNKTADYSLEATRGTVGDKIAKAVTPKNMIDLIPFSKGIKGAKAVYNYFKS